MNTQNTRRFDLEERTYQFAKQVRQFVKLFGKQNDDMKQLSNASGSVAANYIEANESLSRKDYFYRVKICRKEAKETLLWLKLIDTTGESSVVRNKLFRKQRN